MLVSWQFWALLSAFFAALTAIFAKVGISSDINSDFATFIRVVVILWVLVIFLTFSKQWQNFNQVNVRSWIFLTLSAIATGISWLAYFRALQIGKVAQVAPIDKLSVVLVAIFSVMFLGEKLNINQWLGIFFIGLGVILLSIKL